MIGITVAFMFHKVFQLSGNIQEFDQVLSCFYIPSLKKHVDMLFSSW